MENRQVKLSFTEYFRNLKLIITNPQSNWNAILNKDYKPFSVFIAFLLLIGLPTLTLIISALKNDEFSNIGEIVSVFGTTLKLAGLVEIFALTQIFRKERKKYSIDRKQLYAISIYCFSILIAILTIVYLINPYGLVVLKIGGLLYGLYLMYFPITELLNRHTELPNLQRRYIIRIVLGIIFMLVIFAAIEITVEEIPGGMCFPVFFHLF